MLSFALRLLILLMIRLLLLWIIASAHPLLQLLPVLPDLQLLLQTVLGLSEDSNLGLPRIWATISLLLPQYWICQQDSLQIHLVNLLYCSMLSAIATCTTDPTFQKTMRRTLTRLLLTSLILLLRPVLMDKRNLLSHQLPKWRLPRRPSTSLLPPRQPPDEDKATSSDWDGPSPWQNSKDHMADLIKYPCIFHDKQSDWYFQGKV